MKSIIIKVLILFVCLWLPLQVFGADLPTVSSLQDRLAAEVQKMIDAGHLAPGICYFEQHYQFHCSAYSGTHWDWDDYWHNPAETVYTLAIAIPHLPSGMQSAAMTYLENEFNAYPPYTYIHSGPSGAQRSVGGIPTEYQSNWASLYGQRTGTATQTDGGLQGYSFDQFNIYACYKFAQLFPSRVNEIWNAVQNRVEQMPTDTGWLQQNPHVANMYIAGYYGYQGIRQLAGLGPDSTVQGWLNNALSLRVQILNYDPADLEGFEAGGFNWLVPELATYLRNNALTRVQEILAYEDWARPYWFIARAQECTRYSPDRTFMEGYHAQIYDYFSLFAVRAMILQQSQEDLKKYLDAPAVRTGDLYYIQNLVHTIAAGTGGNQSPIVNAGNNQTITLPDDDVSLDGTVSDDGLPDPPATVTQTWTKQSGPGTVTFGNANAVDTTATFSTDGIYVLRLTASDSELSNYDEVTITVNPSGPTNQAPNVDAGSNQQITLPDDDVSLDGTVTDDGLPDPPASVTQTWTKQSGPGTITFGNANAVDTTATFSTDGVYVLRLTASDSALQAYDEVTITVNPAAGNQAPNVDAGSNQSITLPDNDVNLDGTVSDDGLPNPPATVTQTWTKQSGPGTVTFGNANAVDTAATFSTDGVYVLRLTADDSDLQAYDEVTITVNPQGGGEPTDYVLYYNLDDGSGSTAADSSSSGNDGTLSGSPAWTSSGKINGALTFDGVDDVINCSSETQIVNLPTGDFTITWWQNWDRNTSEFSDTIMGKYQATGWQIYVPQTEARIHFSADFDTTDVRWATATATALEDTWQHIAVVFDSAAKTAKIYLDGVEPSYQYQDAGVGSYAGDSGVVMQFGRAVWSGNQFRGTLDDIRIYTRQLSSTEVNAVMNSGGGAPDTDPPTPNPLTWATLPYSTGTTSISMTATTASDPSGVEYYFECTAGGGNDSGWQDSTAYEDTGLSPSTQYTYRAQARDKSANQNAGGWSTSESATTDTPTDTTPPTPDPLTWATLPHSTGTTSISMTATTASDPSGVEYYFECTAGGGNDSGWQDSTTYEDTGLSPSTQYTYRVQARDKSPAQNATGWSTSESATTDAVSDTTPPTPDPLTWTSVPAATGSSSITMTATTASDPSGVEYYFECTAGGGNDSGWQSSASYTDTGLTPETQYTYRVRARDLSANQNATAWSTSESATTEAAGAAVAVFDNGTFYAPWYGTTGTGNIPYSLATTPDGQSTPAAWAQRDDAGWTEIRASGQTNIGDRTFLEFDCYWDTDTKPGTIIAAFHMQVNGDDGWTYKWEGSSQCWIDGVPTAFNPVFAAKTWQHFKLDLTTNIQGGTWPSNPDVGVIRIYQHDAAGSSLYLNNVEITGGTAPPDTTAPTPDPLTWATLPHSTGTTSISMTATTASDPSGVEYYFECTAGGGNDSGWQDSTTYEDTGLTPSTQYTYRVQARDKSANQNAGGWSTTESATTDTPADTTPPTPDPLTWATVPYATGTTSIAMVATTASDPSGVEYYFECTAGGGNDSGWQDSTTYEDTGLSPSTQYTYRVQARDKSANQNAGGWSTSESATTDTLPDTTPPTPDPLTWASVPASTGTTSISMTASTASDPSGVEYYFDCTAGGGNDSGWQDSATYEDTGLTPDTQYTYRVQARDKSANQNAGGWSTSESATTDPVSGWTQLTYDDFESGWGNYTDGGGDCSLYVDGTYAHQGNNAADIQDNSGVASSFYLTNGIDVTSYSQIKVEFWYYPVGMEGGEDFWVQYYDGSGWQTVKTCTSGTDFNNGSFYQIQDTDVIIDSGTYNFPNNMQMRFMCDASGNNDDVYIDEVRISAQAGGAPAEHVVFDGGYQNGWSGIGTTTFQSETVLDAAGGDWSWHQLGNTASQNLSALSYFEYEVYFDSGGSGSAVEWHIIAPTGQEWNATYKFKSPCEVDGNPVSLPQTLSLDTWHTVQLDCGAQSWWSADSDTIQYVKWQWPSSCTAYIRNVKFVE